MSEIWTVFIGHIPDINFVIKLIPGIRTEMSGIWKMMSGTWTIMSGIRTVLSGIGTKLPVIIVDIKS